MRRSTEYTLLTQAYESGAQTHQLNGSQTLAMITNNQPADAQSTRVTILHSIAAILDSQQKTNTNLLFTAKLDQNTINQLPILERRQIALNQFLQAQNGQKVLKLLGAITELIARNLTNLFPDQKKPKTSLAENTLINNQSAQLAITTGDAAVHIAAGFGHWQTQAGYTPQLSRTMTPKETYSYSAGIARHNYAQALAQTNNDPQLNSQLEPLITNFDIATATLHSVHSHN